MRKITDLDVMSEYLIKVMGKADHHAQNVELIALTLVGAVMWKKDGDVQVYEREGDMKNIIWFPVNGKRYVMKYNHKAQTIELRRDMHTGPLVCSFDNLTTPQTVIDIFNTL